MRKAAVSGSFYPEDREELQEKIKEFINCETKKAINGIIVPHAGYIYSGKTAGKGYKAMFESLKKTNITNIIILGPSHQAAFEGILQDENESWETPLGEIKLKKIDELKEGAEVHEMEHSLEVQVPFIQVLAKKLGRELTITPLLVGELTSLYAKQYASMLAKEDSFFVISTDLSHHLNLSYANDMDKETINKIIDFDTSDLEACGRNPLKIIIEIAKMNKWLFTLLDYSTSAQETGDEQAVVGYASICF